MLSLADLRARNVTLTWQEAVAVVQELLQAVLAAGGSADRLPDLEHIALIPNGDIVALPGSPVPEQPVRHLGAMLGLLLEGSNPPGELSALVQRSMASPPEFANPAEFSAALAFFERPGRRSDIERLVSRAAAAEAQSRADEELRRLKEKAAERAERSPLDDTVMMARATPAIAPPARDRARPACRGGRRRARRTRRTRRAPRTGPLPCSRRPRRCRRRRPRRRMQLSRPPRATPRPRSPGVRPDGSQRVRPSAGQTQAGRHRGRRRRPKDSSRGPAGRSGRPWIR